MISEITIGEYDEFLISRNKLDLLVPNLTRSRRDLKTRLLKKLTNIKASLSLFKLR